MLLVIELYETSVWPSFRFRCQLSKQMNHMLNHMRWLPGELGETGARPNANGVRELRIKTRKTGASLVAQWLRVCLPMQGTRVRALVWEDPTCRGAAGPVSHNYWACALEPVLRNKRGRDSERPVHRDEEWPPLAATGESPRTETKTQHSHKQILKKKS